MRKSIELQEKAEYYADRAKAVENNTAISSDCDDAIQKLQDKLAKLEERRTKIKEYNKKARKEGKDSYPSYMLSNLGQNIRSVKQRIEYLNKVKAIPDSTEQIGDVEVEINTEDNRVRLHFPDKPSAEGRTKLKRNGFRWSPYNSAWQRQISPVAIRLAKDIAKEVS